MNDDIIKLFNKFKFKFMKCYPCYMTNYFYKKQHGGAKLPNIIEISYEKSHYKFIKESSDDGEDMYMLYDDRNMYACIMILIDVKQKGAVIENINGDYQGCPNGSKILKIAIEFIKQNKNILNVDKIILTDTASKNCYGKKIVFGDMYTLLYGITWYTKHGFRPYDSTIQRTDMERVKIINNNKLIMTDTKISDIKNLRKYLDEFYNSLPDKPIIYKNRSDIEQSSKKTFNYKKLKNYIKERPNSKLFGFIQTLLKIYNIDSCSFFNSYYKKIMSDIKLTSLRGYTFFMRI